MDSINWKEMAASMEAQLVALYEERQAMGAAGDLKATIRSLEEQLIALYQERQEMGAAADLEGMKAMVANLEECVVALIDDKQELEREVEDFKARLETMKKKGKALGAAIFEATLFAEGAERQRAA